MQITHFGHSCLLVEIDGTKVLFDPGNFSHGFEGISGLDAILITHQHPDHCDVAKLPDLVAGNPRRRALRRPADHRAAQRRRRRGGSGRLPTVVA